MVAPTAEIAVVGPGRLGMLIGKVSAKQSCMSTNRFCSFCFCCSLVGYQSFQRLARKYIITGPLATPLVEQVNSYLLVILPLKVLVLNGSQVTMLGRSEKSLMLAESWGLKSDLVSAAAEDAFDFVVEASGNIEGENLSNESHCVLVLILVSQV